MMIVPTEYGTLECVPSATKGPAWTDVYYLGDRDMKLFEIPELWQEISNKLVRSLWEQIVQERINVYIELTEGHQIL